MKPDALTAKRIRWIGIALFAVSYVIPQIENGLDGVTFSMKDCGFSAFVAAPVYSVLSFSNSTEWKHTCGALIMAVAWLNNFSVFFKFRPIVAWIPIALPWILMIGQGFEGVHFGSVSTYLPFYFWAVGLGVIHVASFVEPEALYDEWLSKV